MPRILSRLRLPGWLAVAALCGAAGVAPARLQGQCVSLTAAGSAYQQNFNTLSNTAGSTTNNLTLTGWFLTETGGGARDNEQYAVDTGSSNTGDIYSYGSAGSTDRALGSLQSGTLIPVIGACFTNNTGATITSLAIQYNGEQWRIGNTGTAREDRLDFQYSLNATGLTTGTWTDVNELDFSSPVQTAASAGALDGNSAANRRALAGTIGSLSVAPGATFWIRWTDVNASGADDGLAVDDFSLTPSAGAVTPVLSISDADVAEGDSGLATATLTVRLSAPAPPGGVTFDIATADNTARAGSDYVAKSFTGQVIPAGSSTYTFEVSLIGDSAVEANETFFVNVTNVVNANVADAQGLVTIVNDDVTLVSIAEIQGSGRTSPIAGAVVTTEGVVTAVRNSGFYVQTPDPLADADPLTSEGIFVFTNSFPPAAAAVGNLVRVTGTVTEFVPSTDPFQLPLTELTGPVVAVRQTGVAVPTPVTIATPSATGAIDQWERYEGMRVSVGSLTVVAPTGGFLNEGNATATSNGIFYAVASGTPRPFREPGLSVLEPLPAGAPCCVPRFDENPELVRVDSDALGAPPLNLATGATIAGLTGVLDYGSRAYTLLPESTAVLVANNGRVAQPVTAAGADQFTVGLLNVERFYDTTNNPGVSDAVLTAAAFNNRVSKLALGVRNLLRAPDVIGLVEVENLTTLQTIAARLNSGPVPAGQSPVNYQAYLEPGNDIGGINVGFLVNSLRATVVDVTQVGKSATYVDPDTNNLATAFDRPPLVLRVTPTGAGIAQPVTIILNHLRSLNGLNDPADSARVRAKRAAGAELLARLVQERQGAGERVLVMGDLNAFEFNDGYVDVVGTIAGNPAPANEVLTATPDLVSPDLTNLATYTPATERYSYSFAGNAQILDHMLVSQSLLPLVAGFEYAHFNADFPETLRNDVTRPERISDHDGAVVRLQQPLPAPVAGVTITRSAPVLNPITRRYEVTVRLTNSTTAPIAGPFRLVVTGLPNGTTLTNAAGQITGVGPFVAVPAASIAPGAAVTVRLILTAPSLSGVVFGQQLYPGM